MPVYLYEAMQVQQERVGRAVPSQLLQLQVQRLQLLQKGQKRTCGSACLHAINNHYMLCNIMSFQIRAWHALLSHQHPCPALQKEVMPGIVQSQCLLLTVARFCITL